VEGRTLFGKQRRSLPGLVRELKDLTVRYAKQETLDPLKSLGRFIAFGVAGSLLIGIGVVFLALSMLRALQDETGEHLTNHLSWVPYLATLAGCLVIAALSAYAITAEKRRMQRRKLAREARERSEISS
jgi:hypothetical protein